MSSTSGNIIIGHNYDQAWMVNLCVADFSGNGTVETADLLSLISKWGPCADCIEDLDQNGTIDAADLLMLLAEWGDCP